MAKINIFYLMVALVLPVGSEHAEQKQSLLDYQQVRQLRQLGYEFFSNIQNFSTHQQQQDEQCLSQLSEVAQGLSSGSLWAIRLVDSWGMLPTGILYGNFKALGNYDECLKLQRQLSDGQTLKGKYCFATLPIGKLLNVTESSAAALRIDTAVCFPDSCTAGQISSLLQQLLSPVLADDLQLVREELCQTAERQPFDALSIFTIVLLSAMTAAMALATLCDYLVYEEQQSIMPAAVRIFSARANSRQLFRIVDSKRNPNVIDCLHGIRCLSLMWVIFGHDYIIAILSPNLNLVHVYKWAESPFRMLVTEAVFSVDTFFFLSGLLVAMLSLRYMARHQGQLNIPLMYLHRYLRLTPLLLIAILVYAKLLRYMGDGPLWQQIRFDDYAQSCGRNWYLSLLYVQNYATKEMCISHSWYLSVDMQLYLLSPLLLLALHKWGNKTVAGIVLLMLLLSGCLFSMLLLGDRATNRSVIMNDTQHRVYFSTHTRAAPWLVGLLFGYFLHLQRGKRFTPHRLAIWLGWLIALALFSTALFALYPSMQWSTPTMSAMQEACFTTMTRIAWPLGLCWLVFACMHGFGGLANSFLSSPWWQPLSKLSYSIYIWHMLIESINGGRTRTNTYFSDYDVMLRFWGDFGFTVLLAYVSYLVCEAPLAELENLLLPMRSSSAQQAPAKTPIAAESVPPLPVKQSLQNV